MEWIIIIGTRSLLAVNNDFYSQLVQFLLNILSIGPSALCREIKNQFKARNVIRGESKGDFILIVGGVRSHELIKGNINKYRRVGWIG
jgi:hypothetical protein